MGKKVRTSSARFKPVAGGTNRRPTLPAEDWAEDARPFRPGVCRAAAEPKPDRLRMKSTPITQEDVLAALGSGWRDAKDVLRTINKGNIDTVRQHLRDLRALGRVERGKDGKRFIWRRVAREAS